MGAIIAFCYERFFKTEIDDKKKETINHDKETHKLELKVLKYEIENEIWEKIESCPEDDTSFKHNRRHAKKK